MFICFTKTIPTTGCLVSGSNSVELASVKMIKNKNEWKKLNKNWNTLNLKAHAKFALIDISENLVWVLPSQPSTLRANSHTASCMPKQTPAKQGWIQI